MSRARGSAPGSAPGSSPGSAPAGRGIGRSLYRALLRAYPAEFRRRFGDVMLADYERLTATPRYAGFGGRVALWSRLLRDLLKSAPKERAHRRRRLSRLRGAIPGGLGSDLRYSLRDLIARPGFAAIVVLTLAVGLGPTTAVYSLAHWLLLRPLPGVADQQDLGVVMYGQQSDRGLSVRRITYANLADLVPRLETLTAFAGMQGGSGVVVFDDGEAEALSMEFVTASFFPALGLEPSAGRFFSPSEDNPVDQGSPVAVITARLATSRFGSPDAAVGQRLRLNRHELEIIGVLPAGFLGPERTDSIDVWLPGSSVFRLRNFPEEYRADARDRGAGFYEFVARAAPGATWQQVEAELAAVNAWLAEGWPEANEGFAANQFLVYPGIGTSPLGRESLAETLWLLGIVVTCILLISCANVANLLLARNLDRRGEIAVRKALGAGTWSLVRRNLVETLLLSGAGAGVGLLVAKGLLRMYRDARLSGMFASIGDIAVQGSVVGFAAASCVAAALVASILPTLGSIRVDVAQWMASSSQTTTRGGRGWPTALGVLQLAAAVPLLVGALLLGQTLRELNRVDLGFDPGNTQVLIVNPNDVGYDAEAQYTYYRRLLDGLAAEPGIEAATVAAGGPFLGADFYTRIRREGTSDEAEVLEPIENQVGDDYFAMLNIPTLYGRTFEPDEILPGPGQKQSIVVLSASLAKSLFGTDRAVGRTVEFAFSLRQDRLFRVVGIVGDVHATEFAGEPSPIAYTPLGVDGQPPRGTVLVRGDAPGARLQKLAADTARRIDPELPLVPLGRTPSLAAAVALHLSERTLLAQLFTSLSATALLLAAIGLYGTVARSVVTRTREIGLRKALGADASRTLLWVLRRAGVTIALGVSAGCAIGLLGMRLIESRLYGVATSDPSTWTATLLVLVLVGIGAAAIPARRAVRLEPMRALRAER